MRIVGIDASLTSTGIATLTENGISTKVIQSKKIGVERLLEIQKEVWEIIHNGGTVSHPKTDLVVIEGYAHGRTNQAHQMGELGGVLRVMFHEMELKWIEVAPTAVKKFVTGKGVATKEKIAAWVQKRWDRMFDTNDEADAYVLVRIGQAYLTGSCRLESLTSFQQEVIDVLKGVKISKKKAGKKLSKLAAGKDGI